jgi:hypothetical protein
MVGELGAQVWGAAAATPGLKTRLRCVGDAVSDATKPGGQRRSVLLVAATVAALTWAR